MTGLRVFLLLTYLSLVMMMVAVAPLYAAPEGTKKPDTPDNKNLHGFGNGACPPNMPSC